MLDIPIAIKELIIIHHKVGKTQRQIVKIVNLQRAGLFDTINVKNVHYLILNGDVVSVKLCSHE